MCPLCDKLARPASLPDEELVWQFPHSVALLGPWQYHSGYCILVARAHFAELHYLPLEERQAFFEEMITLCRAIETCFRPRKLNCESLGNQVPHLHWHIFPRREDDPEALKPVWLGLERAESNPAEKQRLQTGVFPRAEIARRLRAELGKKS